MDDSQFDSFTRVSATTSRRRIVRGAAGGAVGGVLIILGADRTPAKPKGKITICHKPGTPAEKTKRVPAPAVRGHLGHGDRPGACECPEANVCGLTNELCCADGESCVAGACQASCAPTSCTQDSQCPDNSVPAGHAGCVTLREAVGPDGHPTVGICRSSESARNCFDDSACASGQACIDRANLHDGIGVCLNASSACATTAECGAGETCVARYPGGTDTSLPVSGPGVCVASCD